MSFITRRIAAVREALGQPITPALGARIFFDGNLWNSLVEWGYQGKHMGTDQFGNKYYENRSLFYTRSRWVIYGDKADYNASSVPPEWHGWLNYINDYTPKEVVPAPKYAKAHYATKTGSDLAYAPKGAWSNPEKRSWKKYAAWQPQQSAGNQ